MGVLAKVSEMVSSPLGGLVYYLLLLLAVEAALAMAWGEWRRTRRDQAQRLLLALGGLFLVRIIYIVAMLLTSTRWAEPLTLLPPLERFVDTASIALLGWAFMPPARRGGRSWDIVFGANLVAAGGACIVFTLLWGHAQGDVLAAGYNNSWQASVWGLWQMALILLAGAAVVRDRDEGWGLFLVALVVMFVGRLLQFILPAATPNLPLLDRLSNLVAYPLIAVAVYQNIVVRLRVHSRHLQDISQASLDQIKSLLYLFEASQQMSASLDVDAVLDNAVKGITRALDADQCAIAFPAEGDPGQMRLVAIHNPGRQGRGEGVTFPLDYQLTVQHAMRRKKYVIVDETENVQLKVLFALLGSSEVGPLLVQPLFSGEESIGAVIVGNSRSRRPFTPNEAKLCQSMSEQLVSAIRNARRYREAQKRMTGLNQALEAKSQALAEAQAQVRDLTEQVGVMKEEVVEAHRREESAREARNALEIMLVSSRAEVETLNDRLGILESDLSQAHANAEAQLRWQEEELIRRQDAWQEEAQATGRLQMVLQGMTAGVVVAGADGTIQEANVASELLLDRDGAELRNIPLEMISDDQRWKQAVATAMDGEAVRLTMQMGLNTLLCELAPLEADLDQGQIRGVIAIWQDISAEVEAQREQLQAVSTMARELRTPMTAVINYVDLLLSEAVGGVAEAQLKFLQRAKAAAERMIQMTNELVEEASGEEQWASPQRQSVRVEELVERVVAESGNQFEDKSLTLALDLPENLPAVKADPDYLQRVLAHLLSNACLASAKGGRVEVWVSPSKDLPFVPERLEMNGNEFVIVSIKDAGGGLTDDALSRVFDRARPSRTPAGLGESGAGLALVKTLVEAHGGRLWVESEEGVGTTFSFILPVNHRENHS